MSISLRPELRWLKLLAVAGLLIGCAQAEGTSDSAAGLLPEATEPSPGPAEIDPTETVLRVHYPLTGGRSLSVRGSAGPLNWSTGAAMTRKSETLSELRISGLTAPLEWKPLLEGSTWSRGSNYRALPGQTVDVYPHFFTARGSYGRRYRAFHSTVLGNDRGVWIYLPPSFDENPEARYPVVYMHDGQNLFDPRYAFGGRTWKVAETLDAGIEVLDAAAHIPEVIVVAPENTSGRIYEYTPTVGDDPRYMGGGGDLYLRFLRDELKPAVEADALLKNRIYTDGAHTALAGSSLGGLITAYAGLEQPATWSRLGVFSPSTWWDDGLIMKQVAAAGSLTPRFARVYVDSGNPGDSYEDTVKLVEAYRALGYRDGADLKYVVAPGAAHNEDAWAARLPAALRFLCADW